MSLYILTVTKELSIHSEESEERPGKRLIEKEHIGCVRKEWMQ
jgi:hypothetical protein